MSQPQVLGQPDEDGAHQEGLVRVVSDVLNLEHDVLPQQGAEVDRVTALEEPAGRAEPQARQPDPDEPEHVVGDPLAIADLGDHTLGGALEGGKRRVSRFTCARLAERQIPAGLLVRPCQGGAEHLRERLLGPERGDEQRPDQVRVRLQRKPVTAGVRGGFERVQPGRDRVRLAGPDPDDLGAWQPAGHQPVLGLGGLDDEPRDVPPCGGLEQGPDGLRLARARRAAHEHVPVERVPRQCERSGGHHVAIEHLAERDAAVRFR